jgi:hypothetical protein
LSTSRVSAEPIKLDNNDLVAGTNEFEDRCKFVTAGEGLAADLFAASDLAAGGLETQFLRGVILVGTAHTPIPDFSQIPTPTCPV